MKNAHAWSLLYLLFLSNFWSATTVRSESLPTWVYTASSNELNGFRFCTLDLRNNDVVAAGSLNNALGYVMRWDDSGKLLWRVEAQATTLGNGLVCGGLDVDANGNSLVLFQYNGVLSFGALSFTNGNSTKGFVVAKIDSAGVVQWGKTIFGSSLIGGYRSGQIHADADGNVFLFADHTELLVVPYDGGSLRSNPDPYGKTTMVGFSPSGIPLWIRGFESGGAQGYVRMDSFAINSDSLFVTGFFNKAVSWGGTNLTASAPTGFIGQISKSSGAPQWIYNTGPSAQGSETTVTDRQTVWSNIRRLNGASLYILKTTGELVLSTEGPHASSKLRQVASGDVLAVGNSPFMLARYAIDGSLLYFSPTVGSNQLAMLNGIGCDVNLRGDYYLLGNRSNQFSNLSLAKVSVPGLSPEITRQPSATTNQPVAFSSFGTSVAAVGAPPLSYQWRHNGVPIEGATETNYIRLNLLPEHSGNYDCVISNSYGFVISQPHPVRVGSAVIVSQPPVHQLVVLPGQTLSGESILPSDVSAGSLASKILSCEITNTAVGWPTSGNFEFQINPTSTLGGQYDVKAGGVFGKVANTYFTFFGGVGAYYLQLNRFPVSPTNSIIYLYSQGIFSLETFPKGANGTSRGTFSIRGGTNQARFSVTASLFSGIGSLAYQWQKDGMDLPGATNALLSLDNVVASHDGLYRCRIRAFNADKTASADTVTVEARLHVVSGDVAPDPRIQFHRGGAGDPLALQWGNGLRLQRNVGLDPMGWEDVIATSPWIVPVTNRMEFFRVIGR